MRFCLYIAPLFLILALFSLHNAGSEETGTAVLMNAQLSPSQARAALNYEPTKGPLESFFPQCAVDKQKASTLVNAIGQAAFMFDSASRKLQFKIEYSGLSGSPIMAHFHNGAPGVSGPILQTICGEPPPTSAIGFSADALLGPKCPGGTEGILEGTYTLKDYKCPEGDSSCTSLTLEQQVQLLACGNLYVNFHTCLNQPGEISGQIIPLTWLGKELDCNALPPKGK